MARRRYLQIVDKTPGSSTGRTRFGCTEQKQNHREGCQRDVHDIGQNMRPRSPLRKHTGHTCADPEPGRQAHRGAARTGCRSVTATDGQLGDPATADRHRQTERDTAEHPTDGQQHYGIRTQSQEQRPHRREDRRGKHEWATSDPIRERTSDQQRRHDAHHVEEQQRVDRDGTEIAGLAVHHEQRGEFVSTPGGREHRECHGDPRGTTDRRAGCCGWCVCCGGRHCCPSRAEVIEAVPA